jgi:hypothetical protein
VRRTPERSDGGPEAQRRDEAIAATRWPSNPFVGATRGCFFRRTSSPPADVRPNRTLPLHRMLNSRTTSIKLGTLG